MGLHVVGPNGGLATKLTSEAEGVPFKFTNGVDIDETTGDVYFTDSSSVYPRRYASAFHSMLLKFHDRLLKIDALHGLIFDILSNPKPYQMPLVPRLTPLLKYY